LRRSLSLFLVPALAVSLLAGCSRDDSAAEFRIARIGVISPTSGAIAAFGAGIRNSVDLALREANDKGTIPGWELEMVPKDDESKPEVGARQAAELAADPSVVAVVGPYNSGVASETIPVLDRAGLVQISPANTDDTLSRGADFKTNPARPHQNYFRTATLDSYQGAFAADYAIETGLRTVVLVHDRKPVGRGLVDAFRARFEGKGGRVLGGVEMVNPGDKEFLTMLGRIAGHKPDLIFYGGEYPEASLISRQAREHGIRIPLMGGDGIVDKTYGEVSGPASDGDLGTQIGGPPESLPSAQGFVDLYRRAGYAAPSSPYGALAFDAANTAIRALAKVLKGARSIPDGTRRAVIAEVARTDFLGASGRVKFDDFGDTVTRTLTVVRLTGAEFKAVKTADFLG